MRRTHESLPPDTDASPADLDPLPPPAYFVRSLPIMPTAAWMRAKVMSQGPWAAGLVLALAAGAGAGMALSPTCALTGPPLDRPGSVRPPPGQPRSGLPYVVQWGPMPPSLPSRHP